MTKAVIASSKLAKLAPLGVSSSRTRSRPAANSRSNCSGSPPRSWKRLPIGAMSLISLRAGCNQSEKKAGSRIASCSTGICARSSDSLMPRGTCGSSSTKPKSMSMMSTAAFSSVWSRRPGQAMGSCCRDGTRQIMSSSDLMNRSLNFEALRAGSGGGDENCENRECETTEAVGRSVPADTLFFDSTSSTVSSPRRRSSARSRIVSCSCAAACSAHEGGKRGIILPLSCVPMAASPHAGSRWRRTVRQCSGLSQEGWRQSAPVALKKRRTRRRFRLPTMAYRGHRPELRRYA